MKFLPWRRLVLLLLEAGAILALFGLFWFGSIKVPASATGYEVVASSALIKPGQSVRLRPGSYTVTFRGTRMLKQTEKISVGFFSTKSLTTTPKTLSDLELVAHILGAKTTDIRLSGIRYFENGTWFVASVGPNDDLGGDPGPTIARYVSGDWTVVDSGTGVDFSKEPTFPVSLRNYFAEGEL